MRRGRATIRIIWFWRMREREVGVAGAGADLRKVEEDGYMKNFRDGCKL